MNFKLNSQKIVEKFDIPPFKVGKIQDYNQIRRAVIILIYEVLFGLRIIKFIDWLENYLQKRKYFKCFGDWDLYQKSIKNVCDKRYNDYANLRFSINGDDSFRSFFYYYPNRLKCNKVYYPLFISALGKAMRTLSKAFNDNAICISKVWEKSGLNELNKNTGSSYQTSAIKRCGNKSQTNNSPYNNSKCRGNQQ